MSIRKTKVESNYVLKFLKSEFDSSVNKLDLLTGGEMSQAFAFNSGDKKYVIKVDSYNYSYLKDEYASKHFNSQKLPIPEVIKVGKLDEKLYFSISKKIEGKLLSDLTKDEIILAIPSIISTLAEIHSCDISKTNGYGYWDPKGVAKYSSWHEYLLSVNDGITEWRKKYNTDFLDNDIFDRVYLKMNQYVDYCPEGRFLVNGDYGFTNLIIEDNEVAGVLDWGESRFGDFLFDVAWLNTWQDEIQYQDFFLDYYKSNDREVPNFNERIFCYKLHVAFGSLVFYIESGQIEEAIKLQASIKEKLL